METALLPIEQETSVVGFTITAGGTELPSSLPVVSIEVQNEANRVAMACIVIADGDVSLGDWPVSNEAYFVPGTEIEITAGYHGEEESIFKGIVMKHSLRVRQQKTLLVIECKHKSALMTHGRKSNIYNEVTDSDIAATILDTYSLTGNIEDTPVTHAEMVQYDCTDWDFMISRIEAMGFVAIAKEDKIDIIKPAIESTALATLRFGTNLVELDAEIDGCNQYGSVKAQAWDPAEQALVEVTANDPSWTIPGNLDASSISTTAGAEEFVLRQAGRLPEEEVQNWADARLLRSRMAFLCGRARVEGFSKALPGITVAFEGLGDRVNGKGWVSGVRHEIAEGNWLTDLQLGLKPELHTEKFCGPHGSGNEMLPAIKGLHTATVTTLEGDPDSESRIRVKIPSVSTESDGVWARVATPDAGDGRGTFFLPEVDDEVVVGFLHNDPRQPIVLGGLYSSAKPAPLEASDDNHEKGYFSRSGISMLFNDDTITLTITTPAGNTIVLDDDAGEIGVTDQNGNTITMSSSGITIESASDLIMKAKGAVKIESTTELSLKAGTQLKGEGSAGIEIKSSAITTIKGSLVQIN